MDEIHEIYFLMFVAFELAVIIGVLIGNLVVG